MILGIISLILFIIGLPIMFYGGDDGDLSYFILGLAMTIFGFVGIIAFIGINQDTIINWFKV